MDSKIAGVTGIKVKGVSCLLLAFDPHLAGDQSPQSFQNGESIPGGPP